jgi:hypothetical protein
LRAEQPPPLKSAVTQEGGKSGDGKSRARHYGEFTFVKPHRDPSDDLRLPPAEKQRARRDMIGRRPITATNPAKIRLMTPAEALGRIGLVLGTQHGDDRKRLLSIARIAVAALALLDRDFMEAQEIDALQEYANRALFSGCQRR